MGWSFARGPLLALLLGSAGLVVVAPPVHAAGEQTAADVVSGVKAAYKDVQSIRADFTQVRKDAVLKTEDKQRGKLSLKRPRKMRFEFVHPKPSLFVTDGRTLWIYNAELNQVIEQPDLGAEGSGMGILLDDLSRLDELFEVTLVPEDRGPRLYHTLRLVPRKTGSFKSLELNVTKQKYLLQDLMLVDVMDNVTEMHFTGVRLNQDVPDSEFTFVAPVGAQVIRTGG